MLLQWMQMRLSRFLGVLQRSPPTLHWIQMPPHRAMPAVRRSHMSVRGSKNRVGSICLRPSPVL
jgi:hypothetical protein